MNSDKATSSSIADENYQVRRSDFTRQDMWIPKLIGNDSDLGWFYVQFQSCFGRTASVDKSKNLYDNKGLFLRYNTIINLMAAEDYEISKSTLQRHLAELTRLGILSKAKVTSHPRSRIIYIINETGPHQYDNLVNELAARQRGKSQYKDQAKNSAAKKAREASVDTDSTLTEFTSQMADFFTSALKGTRKKSVVAHFVAHIEQNGTVEQAAKAVKDFVSQPALPVTANSFKAGTEAFNVYFTPEETKVVHAYRDQLNKLREQVRQEDAAVKQAEYKERSKPDYNAFRRQKLEEQAAEPELSQEEILAMLNDSFKDVEIDF